MIALARLTEEGKPVSLGRVSEHTHISRRYLDQLAPSLKKASLLKSSPGRSGGYALTRPAEEITIGQIIQAGIGRINIVDCVCEPNICLRSEWCECRLLYVLINRRVTEALDEICLSDIVDGSLLEKIGPELALYDVALPEKTGRGGPRKASHDLCATTDT